MGGAGRKLADHCVSRRREWLIIVSVKEAWLTVSVCVRGHGCMGGYIIGGRGKGIGDTHIGFTCEEP